MTKKNIAPLFLLTIAFLVSCKKNDKTEAAQSAESSPAPSGPSTTATPTPPTPAPSPVPAPVPVPVPVPVAEACNELRVPASITSFYVFPTGCQKVVNTGEVEVGSDAVVYIYAGTKIRNLSLRVKGKLLVKGSPHTLVDFKDSYIHSAGVDPLRPHEFDISYASFTGGSFYSASGSSAYGFFSIRDSNFIDVKQNLYIWYPVKNSEFLRNSFVRSAGISAGLSGGVQLNIIGNTFVEQDGPAISNWALIRYFNSPTLTRMIVENNRFLTTTAKVLGVGTGSEVGMEATNNYWGTSNLNNIDSRIQDSSDDVRILHKVVYLPLLSSDPKVVLSKTTLTSTIIETNRTLNAADYAGLNSALIQIRSGVTLQVAPGTKLSNVIFRVAGQLRFMGSADKPIHLNNVTIEPVGVSRMSQHLVELNYVSMKDGALYAPQGNSGYGSLQINNSWLESISDRIYLWYPTSNSNIVNNMFLKMPPLSVGISGVIKVLVTGNIFLDAPEASVRSWATYDTSVLELRYNHFLKTGAVSVALDDGYESSRADARVNFWGTTDARVIADMIHDSNDSKEVLNAVLYSPFLLK